MAHSGQDLYLKAKKLIPGGTQLLSKRPEMFLPEHWPSYFSKVKGYEVWDLDGEKYVDMSHNGIGACILGAADPDVDEVVKQAINKGTMSTFNCPEEVQLAELLLSLHPWAEMVRYARCGGEAMAIAVRIARAHAKKDVVAFCGYHGWHDWYLSANLNADDNLDGHLLTGLQPSGVPRNIIGTALPFRYNCIAELEAIVAEAGDRLGVIVMEPIRNAPPTNGFLAGVRRIADQTGAVLIADEVSAGFRLCCGGSHCHLDWEPDIAVFAKAISNGYPMAAIIGKASVMSAAQKTFISSTYWTERIGPVAALATITKHKQCQVHEHLIRLGTQVQRGWVEAAHHAGFEITIGGIAPLSHFAFDFPEAQLAKTYFTQAMLKQGYLASGLFYPTYAHSEEIVQQYLFDATQVFEEIARALKKNQLGELLEGPQAHTGFQRLA